MKILFLILVLIAILIAIFNKRARGFLGSQWTSMRESSLFLLYSRFVLWITTGGTLKKQQDSCEDNRSWDIRGVGIIWNHIIGIAVSLLLGYVLACILIWFTEFIAEYLSGATVEIPEEIRFIVEILIVALSFPFMYMKRLKSIDSHSAQRILIFGQGLVVYAEMYRTLENLVGTVILLDYKTLREGVYWIPFGVELDPEKIDLQETSLQMSKEVTTKTDDNVEVKFKFGRAIRIVKDGSRYSMMNEKTFTDNATQSLQNAVKDLVESLKEDFLFTRSASEIQQILLSKKGTDLPFIGKYFKARKQELQIKKPTLDSIALTDTKGKTLNQTEREALLAKALTEHKQELAFLKQEEKNLRENIERVQGQLLVDDERYGIVTLRIFQDVLDYANEAARKALEQKWIQERTAEADRVRVESFGKRIEEYLQKVKDGSETFATARRAVQNLYGDRTEIGVDSTGNPSEGDKMLAGFLSKSGEGKKK